MTNNETKTILYVEDDADFRQAIRTMLEAGGYAMVEASTAEEGLEQYRQHQPDLLLVDLMMEEVDAGTNLVTQLRADGVSVPIYLLTSLGDTLATIKNADELGIAGVLQKPVRAQTLLAILKTKLG